MEHVDVNQLVNTLQERVAVRRANGDYPPGLEEELEAEFEHIMRAVHRREIDTFELGQRVRRVEASIRAVNAEPVLTSRIPGGRGVHSTAAKVVRRHTGTLADTVRALGVDIAGALHEILHLIELQRDADERQLDEVISSLLDRVAVIDHVAKAVLDIERRLERLEAGPTPA